MSNHETRESWLRQAVIELRALFEREGSETEHTNHEEN